MTTIREWRTDEDGERVRDFLYKDEHYAHYIVRELVDEHEEGLYWYILEEVTVYGDESFRCMERIRYEECETLEEAYDLSDKWVKEFIEHVKNV